MNSLIKILSDVDGPVPLEDQCWHVTVFTDTIRTACGLAVDAWGDQEEVLEKTVLRGGITCVACLNTVAEFKNIKL